MSDSELANPTMGDAEVTVNEDASSPTAATPETAPANNAAAIQPAKQPAPVTLTKVVLADMSTEELDKIVIESMLVNRERLIPALKEMRRLYSQPGCRKPIPGLPTWTEYVDKRIGRSIRTVQYWLEEPSAKIARGSKKKDPKPKPQLNPDPEKYTEWAKSAAKAQEYCRKLIDTIAEEEKRANPLLPLLSAVAETPSLGSLPDTMRAFFRNLVRNFPTEERERNAELVLEAARTELDLLRDEPIGWPAAPQVPSDLPINAEQTVDDEAANSEAALSGDDNPASPQGSPDKQPYTEELVGSAVLPLVRAPERIEAPANPRRRKLLLDFDEDVFDSALPKPVAPQLTDSSVAAVAV